MITLGTPCRIIVLVKLVYILRQKKQNDQNISSSCYRPTGVFFCILPLRTVNILYSFQITIVRSDILTLISLVFPYRYNLCIIPRFGIHTQSFDITCYFPTFTCCYRNYYLGVASPLPLLISVFSPATSLGSI